MSYKRIGNVRVKMHPTHCANCAVIRSHGFKWDKRARLWRVVTDLIEAEFNHAGHALDFVLYHGAELRLRHE